MDTFTAGDLVLDQGVRLGECLEQPVAVAQFTGQLTVLDAVINGADRLLPVGAIDDDVEGRLDVSPEMSTVRLLLMVMR